MTFLALDKWLLHFRKLACLLFAVVLPCRSAYQALSLYALLLFCFGICMLSRTFSAPRETNVLLKRSFPLCNIGRLTRFPWLSLLNYFAKGYVFKIKWSTKRKLLTIKPKLTVSGNLATGASFGLIRVLKLLAYICIWLCTLKYDLMLYYGLM